MRVHVRRPRVDAKEDPRPYFMALRVSLVERAMIVRAAERNKQTLSEFIRTASQEAAGDCLDLDHIAP